MKPLTAIFRCGLAPTDGLGKVVAFSGVARRMVEKTPADPEFEALLRYIQESRGLDFRGYKRTSLRRRIALRMEAVGVEHFSAYQAHLEVHPGEFGDLLNTVLINVTSFFRDEEAWTVLRDRVIPQVLANAKDERHIRVWSVGCASGEEPYSLAMLFAEAMGAAEFCRRVKIYATDLDEDALKAARLATYQPATSRACRRNIWSAISSAPTTTTSFSATCANA
jgi:two-component system CheB/CheR fusion protein